MEHFAFPGNIDFAADDQGAFHVILMPGCCVYSSSVKQCLLSVNHEQFPIQMTQNCKHSKCLQILAEKDFPLKLLGRTPIKIYRRADRRRQPRSREHRFSTAKVTSSTQRPQTCTEAATKYYNYIVNETDEEREHRLPTLTKAAGLFRGLDQETLKVYSQNYLLRCSDRQQELCTSRISFQRLGTADRPLHHEQQWVLQ
ncbi:unnamed protein product [Porites lobata]|uniref:Uncharacterized protein n=1 Tax=Porites lobata TaxID=104759 RepID=A0ABN8PX80_9CNID|nr:unnamed protein product [Porites lobata]